MNKRNKQNKQKEAAPSPMYEEAFWQAVPKLTVTYIQS